MVLRAALVALGFRTITDFAAEADAIRCARYGVIEVVAGRLECVRLRPWPKLASWAEIAIARGWTHARGRPDRCWLYYNQPRRVSKFLALKYVVSTRATTLATFRGALGVLDEIARIKRSDAILCDAANNRISDRLLARWGWEPHAHAFWRRNHIKRFYGEYPPPHPLVAEMLAATCASQTNEHHAAPRTTERAPQLSSPARSQGVIVGS